MDKKLPKVFANKISKELNNNDKVYYERGSSVAKKSEGIKITGKNVLEKINHLFSSPNFIYKISAIVTTKNGKIEKDIVGKTSSYLITFDNDRIYIDDIIDIERK